MSAALTLIRALRRLPHTRRFDRHLDDCAAHVVLYQDEDERVERLTWRHVLRLAALPLPFVPERSSFRVVGGRDA